MQSLDRRTAQLGDMLDRLLARRLWPRALLTPFTDNVRLTEADKRAYASYARMQRHKGFEKVVVRWDPGPAEKLQEAEQAPEPGTTDGTAPDETPDVVGGPPPVEADRTRA